MGKAGTDRLVANILLVLRKSIFNPSFQVDPISVSVFLLRELIPCIPYIRELKNLENSIFHHKIWIFNN